MSSFSLNVHELLIAWVSQKAFYKNSWIAEDPAVIPEEQLNNVIAIS